MPHDNRFRHQSYNGEAAAGSYEIAGPPRIVAPNTAEFDRRMADVGRKFEVAGVAAMYLLHGTFVGSDALGLWSAVERIFPRAGSSGRRFAKRLVDAVMQDRGNYPPHYAELMQSGLAGGGEAKVPVRMLDWSGANHHLARADGAVRLIDRLASDGIPPNARVLCWAHSHGGNGLTLATNLLGGSREAVEEFFQACRPYYRRRRSGQGDIPHWRRVEELLAAEDHPIRRLKLDLVTFGSPIRYGWETRGYAKLLHFVNHRPSDGLPETQAPALRGPDSWQAMDGDIVHQIGIAGTNISINPLAWRAWLADRRLNRLLQSGHPLHELPQRLFCGKRVCEEGLTLLVDYGLPHGDIVTHLSAHAAYTRLWRMAWHLEEVCRRFYETTPSTESRRSGESRNDVSVGAKSGVNG